MSSLKTAVFIGCMLGIAFALIKSLVPEKKIFKNLKMIMSLVLLVSVITTFSNEEFDFSFEAYRADAQVNSDELQKKLDEAYVAEIENIIEKNVGLYFLKNEIEAKKLVIDTRVDEYNFLEVEKVRVSVADNDAQKALELLRTLLGNDVEVEFCDED